MGVAEGAQGLCPEPQPEPGAGREHEPGSGEHGDPGGSSRVGGVGWAPGLSSPYPHPATARPSRLSLAQRHLAALWGSGGATSSLPAGLGPKFLEFLWPLRPQGREWRSRPQTRAEDQAVPLTLKGRKGWRQRLKGSRL